jgi:RNA polymerase sigma factor for flagellar operon FliA
MKTKVPPIDRLWKRYLKNKADVNLRNRLVEHYTSLVHAHAGRLAKKLPAQISYDEICSAAYDGLIEAVEAYDPQRKARFETFCQQRIRGAVMDWLRTLDGQSRTVRSFEKRVAYTREILDAELGRTPTSGEIAARLGITSERFEYLTRLSQLGREVHFSSLEANRNDNSRSNYQFWDVGDRGKNDPSAGIARQMLTEYITRGLSREERLVLILYYYEELTMSEIGLILKLSESRVSQIHKDVLLRLRKRLPKDAAEDLVA